MKDYKSKGHRSGSVASRSGRVLRDAATGRYSSFKGIKGSALSARTKSHVKVYAGPSVNGRAVKLIEVVSGNVVDKSPV